MKQKKLKVSETSKMLADELRRELAKTKIMKMKFWKDNKLDGEHDVDVVKIIKEFLETEDSKLDMPFERLILNFMSNKYGSFDTITDEEWQVLHDEYKKQR